MSKILNRFAKDESGATAIEYGLIAALIALAVIGGARLVGGQVDQTFRDISDAMSGAATPDGDG